LCVEKAKQQNLGTTSFSLVLHCSCQLGNWELGNGELHYQEPESLKGGILLL